ncbi:hypothetical protein ACFVWX_16215 [Streptomyces sp. NPDC058220]|uniref:hypothetical protein n=1 Tax=unclassified Streptomyces TaxID=2593676 RepID=UPI003653729E
MIYLDLIRTEVALTLVRADADPEAGDAADIHLACAEQLEQALTAFVTYDKRLAAVAGERDLPVRTPGA